MKSREGFVSNSSSTSFIIHISTLKPKQLYSLLNRKYDNWKIGVENQYIIGYASMDNHDIEDSLLNLKICSAKICRYPYHQDYDGLVKLIRAGKENLFNGLYGVWNCEHKMIREGNEKTCADVKRIIGKER